MAAAAALPAVLAEPRAAPLPTISTIVAERRACILDPLAFFCSWNGVLTLAYRGFPQPLVATKAALTEFFTALPKENPGSRWPKTSLGALKDGARLTPDQLARLNAICKEASRAFEQLTQAHRILVDRLAVVVYECRCLERQVSKQEVALGLPADESPPSPEEQARVEGIVAEADQEGYWFHASRDGSREAHYRSDAPGVTLVHELACFKQPGGQQGLDSGAAAAFGAALPGLVRQFRQQVDAALPGMYAWFDDASLHVTVRAIIA